jgi:hypothetical protein
MMRPASQTQAARTSTPANDNIMELQIMTDALRRSSASRNTAVTCHIGYVRQDRRATSVPPKKLPITFACLHLRPRCSCDDCDNKTDNGQLCM